jgi:hypothetical protein
MLKNDEDVITKAALLAKSSKFFWNVVFGFV